MRHEEVLRDDSAADEPAREARVSTFLSPAVCAVSSFALAMAALLGQNAVSVGMGAVFESQLHRSQDAFFVSWSVAVAVQVVLIWLLARRSLEVQGGWESVLGRAAVVLSLVALAAGALVVLGDALG